MPIQTKINHIREKITQVNLQRKAKEQKLYVLNPTLSEKEIQVFENQHDIQLSEEYRAFLLQIGNGNQEQYHKGIYRLEDADKFNYADEKCLDLKTPFPFNQQIGLEIIWEDIYRFYPAQRVWDIRKASGEERVLGCLLINYEGWGSSHTALVVSGEARGMVWHVDDLYHPYYVRKGKGFITFSFLEWVEYQLDMELNPSAIELLKSGNYLEINNLDLSGEAQEWQKSFSIEEVFKCANLEFLDLSRNYNLKYLPESIENLQNLVELKFNGGSLKKLPDNLGKLQNLEKLELAYQSYKSLPRNLGKLKNLKKLSLYWNSNLRKLPKSITQLKHLISLELGYSDALDWADTFPKIAQLPHIQSLSVDIEKIPPEVASLQNIRQLFFKKIYGTPKLILNKEIQQLTALKSLGLDDCGLKSLPVWMGKLQNLESLTLSNNQLKNLPESIGNLNKLKYISLENNDLRELPESFSQLKSLEKLEIAGNLNLDWAQTFSILGQLPSLTYLYILNRREIPSTIGDLKNLTDLNLASYTKKPQTFPVEIGNLIQLDFIRLVIAGKLTIPPEFTQLRNLRILRIEAKGLELPDNFEELTHLHELNLSDCDLKHLPKSLGQLQNLEYLYLEGNLKLDLADALRKIATLPRLKKLRITAKKLPPEIGLCTQIEHLEIYNHTDYKNYEIPLILAEEIGQLSNLKHLDVSDNHLIDIPESIGNLRNLQYLDLSENRLSTLPDSICHLTNLRELHLYKNQLTNLPYYIGNLQELLYLDISDNQLVSLRVGLIKLFRLRELLLRNNPISEIPEELNELPSLQRIEV